ncbi:MAG TPA: type II toxin-antitoxin system RelE/ParE family toxin [Bradyrhizobium sp.]|nr:type II toxin-antitoxin system RelE/ParE family toxin [Bradyrhizobium sp.]
MTKSRLRSAASTHEASLYPRATQDLTDIAEYILTRNPNAAQRVRAAILRSLQILIRYPYVGRPQAVEGVRKLITRQYQYLVYYTVDEPNAEIVVLSIQHPAREREYQDA